MAIESVTAGFRNSLIRSENKVQLAVKYKRTLVDDMGQRCTGRQSTINIRTFVANVITAMREITGLRAIVSGGLQENLNSWATLDRLNSPHDHIGCEHTADIPIPWSEICYAYYATIGVV